MCQSSAPRGFLFGGLSVGERTGGPGITDAADKVFLRGQRQLLVKNTGLCPLSGSEVDRTGRSDCYRDDRRSFILGPPGRGPRLLGGGRPALIPASSCLPVMVRAVADIVDLLRYRAPKRCNRDQHHSEPGLRQSIAVTSSDCLGALSSGVRRGQRYSGPKQKHLI